MAKDQKCSKCERPITCIKTNKNIQSQTKRRLCANISIYSSKVMSCDTYIFLDTEIISSFYIMTTDHL